jgi:hypothetical protein
VVLFKNWDDGKCPNKHDTEMWLEVRIGLSTRRRKKLAFCFSNEDCNTIFVAVNINQAGILHLAAR